MKTITFYSYKGGVGRSLALANMATRLAEFDKKVCIIDFDLEAPGLPVKFEKEIKQPIKNGIVDYIYEYANKGLLPDKILDYSIPFELKGNKNFTLIPAGNIEGNDYWQKLSSIDWYNLVYQNPNSISFFLDLKQKIKKEIDPDFLLIDSRTGISEMSGITISLLADDIVIVSANNKENLSGSKKLIAYLSDPEKAILGKVPKITFVLSRIPFADNPADKGREQRLIEKLRTDLPLPNPNSFYVIHSDRDIEEDETIKISNPLEEIVNGTNKPNKSVQIIKDYLALFAHITEGLLDKKDQKKIIDFNESATLLNKAMNTTNRSERIGLLDQAIQLNPYNIFALINRGSSKVEENDYEAGIKDWQTIIEIDPESAEDMYNLIGIVYCDFGLYEKAKEAYNKIIETQGSKVAIGYYGMGVVYYQNEKKDIQTAIEYFTKAIENNYSNLSFPYNNRASSFRQLGDYDHAFEDVFKALELNPENGSAYFTLAEIYASIDKLNEFYLNLEIGLSKDAENFVTSSLLIEKSVYSKFYKEERFINLLDKYNIPVPSYAQPEKELSFIEKAREIKRKNDLVEFREYFLKEPKNFEIAEKAVVDIFDIIKTKADLLGEEKIYFRQSWNQNFPQYFILQSQSEQYSFSLDWSIVNHNILNAKLLKDAKLTVRLCHGIISWGGNKLDIKQIGFLQIYEYFFDTDTQKKYGWKLPNDKNFHSNDSIANLCINWILDKIDESLSI